MPLIELRVLIQVANGNIGVHDYFSFIRQVAAGDDIQQTGLTGAIFGHKRKFLPLIQTQIDLVEQNLVRNMAGNPLQ